MNTVLFFTVINLQKFVEVVLLYYGGDCEFESLLAVADWFVVGLHF
jgi:hypothetical protein